MVRGLLGRRLHFNARNRMRSKQLLTALGIILLLTGLALPAGSLGTTVSPVSLHHAGEVTTGLWLFKLMLVLHGGLLLAWGRLPLLTEGAALLSPRSLARGSEEPAWAAWAAGALVLLGLGLRLPALAGGLWFDEIQTLAEYVRLPLGQIVTRFDSQNQHLLYSVTARLVTTLGGEGAITLRLPAVAFGVASLWATWRFGRTVAGWREALLATALLAVSYHHVWFSQNARGYTGLLLWTVVATGCFLRLLSGVYEDGRRLALLYGLAMALAVYTHATAVLVAVAHAGILALLVLRRWPESRGGPALASLLGLVLAGSLSLLLYAPVLPQFAATLTEPSAFHAETEWQNPTWMALEAMRGLAGGLPGGWVALGLGAGVLAAGLVSYARQGLAILGAMVLPGLVTLAAIILLRHNLWPRFFFFSATFAVLIVIRGGFSLSRMVTRAHGGRLALAGTVVVILASALTVPRAWGPKQDFVAAMRYVDAQRGPDDAVATVDLTTYPLTRYYARDWVPVEQATALRQLAGAHPRTWVLYTFPVRLAAAYPDVWQELADYQQMATFPGTVGGGAIVVLASRPPVPADSASTPRTAE